MLGIWVLMRRGGGLAACALVLAASTGCSSDSDGPDAAAGGNTERTHELEVTHGAVPLEIPEVTGGFTIGVDRFTLNMGERVINNDEVVHVFFEIGVNGNAIRSYTLGDESLFRNDDQPNAAYAIITLGSVGCEFIACRDYETVSGSLQLDTVTTYVDGSGEEKLDLVKGSLQGSFVNQEVSTDVTTFSARFSLFDDNRQL